MRNTGNLPQELWTSIGRPYGRKCEEALLLLFDALDRGEAISFLAPPIRNTQKRKVWIKPAISEKLDQVATDQNVSFTVVIGAALRYYLEVKKDGPDPS